MLLFIKILFFFPSLLFFHVNRLPRIVVRQDAIQRGEQMRKSHLSRQKDDDVDEHKPSKKIENRIKEIDDCVPSFTETHTRTHKCRHTLHVIRIYAKVY